MSYSDHKLLVANRGEIALRIIRSAKQLGIPTVVVYTQADATSPHVSEADESVALREEDEDPASNAQGYLDAVSLVDICKSRGVTLVHPGYGFLSENSNFAQLLLDAGITLLGPSVDVIRDMGLKHRARALAVEAGVPVVPGSEGLLKDVEEAIEVSKKIGFPVMLKSTAGGGGMGLVICRDSEQLRSSFVDTQARAQTLFHDDGVFVERYFPAARHIEVQVFGNGLGHVIHMGERECSVQRRHQKVIEEAPSPFFEKHPDVREKMLAAAVRLCERIKYKSAGTCEFIVDDASGEFFFLEMNTRLQVEHPVTEMLHPGLDIVKLMILQGVAERDSPIDQRGLHPSQVPQQTFLRPQRKHAIEARIYCENPAANFKPSPGVLQHVSFPEEKWLRVDSWIGRGTTITPFYDPLACKIIVYGSSREEAVSRLSLVLDEIQIHGPPNNISYLKAICNSDTFKEGSALTTFLDKLVFTPNAVDVISGGLETTVQDGHLRSTGLGIPISGPMDVVAFRAANSLVGNTSHTEALEVLLPAGMAGLKLFFHVTTVIAITGASANVTVDGEAVPTWSKITVPAGGRLALRGLKVGHHRGFRVYIAFRGGFPHLPEYLGSKSTSMGMGGYQGRALLPGDQLILGSCGLSENETPTFTLPRAAIPDYPDEWTIYSLSGPHDDPEFITPSGIEMFYSTKWTVSSSSNRMGIRLEGPPIDWARENGGDGGSHPSNILDNAYAAGTVNINGDTPVILTNEAPSMGGYVCVTTVATADQWKLGQLQPGSRIQFIRISWSTAMELHSRYEDWHQSIEANAGGFSAAFPTPFIHEPEVLNESKPVLRVIPADSGRPQVVFRQAGDSAILLEYGDMVLDFACRARIHALQTYIERYLVDDLAIWNVAPCIRSIMIAYENVATRQEVLIQKLFDAEIALPSSVDNMEFTGRRIKFPIVVDDRWNRDALRRYMDTTRDNAVYLPSNIDYLAKNNALESARKALELLTSTSYLVFGVGFYLACPFLIPIDPRCRLVAQKMNPSRTFTPRGSIGIAGLVTAIYPVESPGGYQLFGRTLPSWQTWGIGHDFEPNKPWLLNSFDQVVFECVTEERFIEILRDFDAGRYVFEIEDVTFSMRDYNEFISGIQDEIRLFRDSQLRGVAEQEAKERELLQKWRERNEIVADTNLEYADVSAGSSVVTSSLAGSIWKISVEPGHIVQNAEETLLILEAMKTEIRIEAGEENVGRKVKGFGSNVRQGAYVTAGEALIILE